MSPNDHSKHRSQAQQTNEHAHDCCDHGQSQKPTDPLDELRATGEQVLTTFKVTNMDCADEIKAINEALKFDGIFKVQSNLMSSTIQVLHSHDLTANLIKKKIETTVVRVVDEESASSQNQNRHRILIVAASGALLIAGLAVNWMKLSDFISAGFFLGAIALGGSIVFPKAYGSLKRRTLDMNVLMTIAVIGAMGIQEFSEAAAVAFLFSLSELLESLSVQRARKAIQDLLKIAPPTALRVNSDGTVSEKNVSEIGLSEVIRVKAGESIPVDGTVVSGSSSVNQAPLTGESLPVLKTVGESVFAGTINQEGRLDVKVIKLSNDTKISQVIRLVEQAQSQRAVSQKFVDRFAEIYTPAVLALASLTFLIPPLLFGGHWYDWFYKALVLLVIACPCALVISTPVSIVSSLTALARKGVLIKGGAILETLGKIRALAMDKTGTLTEGRPQVQKIIRFNSLTENQILEIAKSLEAHSTHPIARAIIETSDQRNITAKSVEKFLNISGRGVEAIIEGHSYLLGNHRFAHEVGICTPSLEQTLQELEDQSLSVVVIGHKPHDNCSGEVIGVIALGDTLRPDSQQTVQALKKAGIENVTMLSGDNQKTATAIGNILNLDAAFGDLLPEDKVSHIEKLKSKYRTIAMIGDGVNDAPAMAHSSIGIAMGFIGSDTAIETADITLVNDDLQQVVTAICAGRRTLRIIQFNIGFALITKAIFLLLTFAGFSNLWLAVAADTGAALLVIMNSLRLLKID